MSSFGELTASDLLVWAQQQSVGGSFFINPAVTTSGIPDIPDKYFVGTLEIGKLVDRKITITNNGMRTFVNKSLLKSVESAMSWIGWKEIPTATPSQEYSLPLAEGISTYGKSTYWKTYDGICFINFALKSTQPITNESVIATLPVGFRPSVTVFAGSHGYLEANTGARVAIDVEVRLNGSIVIWTEDPLSNISGFIGFIADS